MRILTAYCPHCDANVLTTCRTEGTTSANEAPEVWFPAVIVCCPVGHVIARFGAVGGPDPALDVLLGRALRLKAPEPTGVPA